LSSQYSELYEILGYSFKDESLIREALTHPSLEAGYLEAEKFIRKFWHEMAHNVKVAKRDAKTRLQELVQSRGKSTPVYTTIDKKGPDHQPTFTIVVSVQGEGEETAKGFSKRDAEQLAAEKILKRLKSEWKI
jgi:ribonuclease-3